MITNNKIKFILIYLVAIVMTIVTFLHILFDPVAKETLEIKKSHIELKNERNRLNNELVTLFENYEDSIINKSQYDAQFPILFKKYIKKKDEALKAYNNYKSSKKSNEFFKFKNIPHFLYTISLPLNFLIISLLILFLSAKRGNKLIIRAITFLAYTMMFISLFFIIWVVSPKSDLPYWIYIIGSFIASILISTSLRYFYIRVVVHSNRMKALESTLQLTYDVLEAEQKNKEQENKNI